MVACIFAAVIPWVLVRSRYVSHHSGGNEFLILCWDWLVCVFCLLLCCVRCRDSALRKGYFFRVFSTSKHAVSLYGCFNNRLVFWRQWLFRCRLVTVHRSLHYKDITLSLRCLSVWFGLWRLFEIGLAPAMEQTVFVRMKRITTCLCLIGVVAFSIKVSGILSMLMSCMCIALTSLWASFRL